VAAPANSVDMPATEKYPETPAKAVAAKNVAALVIRAPERTVEGRHVPRGARSGLGHDIDGASCIGGRPTACAVPEAGGRSAVATVWSPDGSPRWSPWWSVGWSAQWSPLVVGWVVAIVVGPVVAVVVG